MKKQRSSSPHRQHGNFVMGLIVGLLVGLALALGVALYIAKVPVPFINKVPQRTAEQDAAETERNKNWDPNSSLHSKTPARAHGASSGVGGAASGPYSLPGNVRMSTDSATSKRCSSLQSTISAASGVRSGQLRQSPAFACLKVSLPRGPREMVLAVRPELSVCGIAVIKPAMSRPPSAVSSSARRVEAACRLRHQGARDEGRPASSSCGYSRVGASDICSIVTGVSGAVTSDAVVTLWGCVAAAANVAPVPDALTTT